MGTKKDNKHVVEMKKDKDDKDELLTQDEMYTPIYLYFQQPNVLYMHHADSFSKLIQEDVPKLLSGSNKFYENIVDNVLYVNRFEFSNFSVKTSMMDNDVEYMYPSDARENNMTYYMKVLGTCRQMVDIITLTNGKKTTKMVGKDVHKHPIIGTPLLLTSKYDNAIWRSNKEKSMKDCKYDPGNYFIIKGNEKFIVPIERMRDNFIMVFIKKDVSGDIYTAQINSRSHENIDMNTQTANIKYKKDKTMIFRASILNDIPVFILLRALGLQSDKDIIDNIVQDPKDIQMINEVMASIEKTKEKSRDETKDKTPILTQIDAYNNILSKIRPIRKYSETNEKIKIEQKKLHLNNILNNDLLPHVSGDIMDKTYCICMMINKLLQCVLGRTDPDDRDSFVNKRIETTGELIGQLIKQSFKKMLSECSKFFSPRNTDPANPINIIEQIKSSIIEQAVTQAIMLGSFGSKNKKGIAQVVQRLSYVQTTSYLRRINSPTDPTVKLTLPRHVHVTQFGYCDPNESPEGAKIGLVKNLALMATITNTLYDQIPIIKEFLEKYIVKYGSIPAILRKMYVKVFLNGDLLGICIGSPIVLVDKLKDARRRSVIHKHVSICYNFDTMELRLYCDGGRLIRPLLCVDKDNHLLLKRKHIKQISLYGNTSKDSIATWNRLTSTYPELVEYIDVEESCYSMIAMYPKDLNNERKIMNKFYKDENKEQAKLNRFDGIVFRRFTHCEFHPSMILGIISSNTAWLHCNQSPRNIFQYNYAKQAMSIYISNFRDRFDISYILYYPEVPLVGTKARRFLNTDKLPSGQNITLAIGCFTGYDQEDALIINDSSADRGLLLAKYLKKLQAELKKNASTSKDDMFAKPNPDIVSGISDANYDKLNQFGYVDEHTEVMSGDIIVGKITPQAMTSADVKPYKDTSEPYKDSLPAMIDKVVANKTNMEGYGVIKTRLNSLRPIVVGDKFASCYDEKTEVLTLNRSWIFFKDLKMTDLIATLVDDEEVVYTKPSEIMKYDYDSKIRGPMYYVDNNQINLLVTPNHKMYVRTVTKNSEYKRETAEEVFNKVRHYKKNAKTYEPKEHKLIDGKYFLLPKFVGEPIGKQRNALKKYKFEETIIKGKAVYEEAKLDLDAWCRFIGIWLAEGCMVRDWGVSFASHKQRVKDALRKCEKKLGDAFEIREHSKDNKGVSNQWVINNRQLVAYMLTIKEIAINKRIPDWAFYLEPKYAYALIDGMLLGDGHYNTNENSKTPTRQLTTSSLHLRDGFQQLALHIGFAANYRIKSKKGSRSKGTVEGRVITTNADSWVVTLVTKQCEPKINKNKYTKKATPKSTSVKTTKSKSKKKTTPKSTSAKTTKSKKDDSDSDEEIEVKKNYNPSKKKDDSDSDDEVDVKKKTKKTKDDSDLDEEVEVKKKTKKKTKDDSDSDEDDKKVEVKKKPKIKPRTRGGQQDSWVDYKGKVYCCTVPSHVIYVRREGKTVWSANSDAQKGVCGLLLKQEDMPYTVPFDNNGYVTDSVIPNAIINPHAIPSRMTIAHLLSMLAGKVASRLGRRIDGTPFNDLNLVELCDLLEKVGLHRFGVHRMINGMTGRTFDALIFVGPIYYQRLKHLVFDKYYARARGPKQILTRQPPEGRVRDGGLRFGEMEQWCMLSHGMAQFLKEVLLDKSDIYATYICDICGLFAQRMLNKDVWHCPACPSMSDMSGKNNTRISRIVIPYTCKLLFQELMALNIAPRIRPYNTLYNIGMF